MVITLCSEVGISPFRSLWKANSVYYNIPKAQKFVETLTDRNSVPLLTFSLTNSTHFFPITVTPSSEVGMRSFQSLWLPNSVHYNYPETQNFSSNIAIPEFDTIVTVHSVFISRHGLLKSSPRIHFNSVLVHSS